MKVRSPDQNLRLDSEFVGYPSMSGTRPEQRAGVRFWLAAAAVHGTHFWLCTNGIELILHMKEHRLSQGCC
jgi:hypothetical protein